MNKSEIDVLEVLVKLMKSKLSETEYISFVNHTIKHTKSFINKLSDKEKRDELTKLLKEI